MSNDLPPARLLVDARATLGECVLWCDRGQALYWTDIEAATLSRWREADGSIEHWTLPERVGSFALCEQPSQLLLGLASGIALFDLDSRRLGPIQPVEAEHPTTRINDGRCDAQGRFVFGMYDQSPAGSAQAASGASGAIGAIGGFYRVDAELRIERLPLPPAAVANSIAFSPDGSRMYFTDSPTREILCCDYHADGRIGTPRLFARLGDDEGVPDGSTVDAAGGLWNAQWGGGCVVRYDASGVPTARIAAPASQLTCPAFGGARLDQLFVSSARGGLDADALQAQPLAGGVFVAEPGGQGLPERRFRTERSA